MPQVGSTAAKKLFSLLAAESGMPASVSIVAGLLGIKAPPFVAHHVLCENAAPELAEKSGPVKYPVLYVFCAKVTNSLREKFRTFSGEASMIIEVRVSQDRLDGIEALVQLYADAVMYVLDQSRGDWGGGFFYTGGYEATYGPVKHGGRNFIQIAKIGCTVQVSGN